MATTPNNRPAGRQRTGGGMGNSVSTHGAGLGTGPVGKSDGYQQRRQGGSGGGQQRSGGSRGLGKGSILIVLVLIAVAIFGGKGLFGGNNDVDIPAPSAPSSQSSSGGSSLLGSLLSGYSGSYSGG